MLTARIDWDICSCAAVITKLSSVRWNSILQPYHIVLSVTQLKWTHSALTPCMTSGYSIYLEGWKAETELTLHYEWVSE